VTQRADVWIVHYDAERIPDDRPGAGLRAAEWFGAVRNAIVETCRCHGPTGPDDFGAGVNYDTVVYYVVADQFNTERYQYTEVCKPEGMTRAWLLDLMAALGKHRYWGIGIRIPQGYMLVFDDRLMVTGVTFQGCVTLDDLVRRAREALAREQIIKASRDDASLERLSHLPGIDKVPMELRNLQAVTDAGLVFVARLSGVSSVVLDKSRITDQGLAHLQALTNLDDLWLQDTKISSAGLAHLRHLPRLRQLVLGGCAIDDDGLASLKALPSLEEVFLDRTAITDDGVPHLQHLPNLTSLQLGHCQVGDRGLVYLSGLKKLRTLDLNHTNATDLGLVHLESLQRLENLNLTGTQVTAKGLKRLKKALPCCGINCFTGTSDDQ
jgi:hypothetical protein